MPSTVLGFEQMPGNNALIPLFRPVFPSPSHPPNELPYTLSELLPNPPSHIKQTRLLFTVVKIWKQPKCPSIGEWIKRMCVCVCGGGGGLIFLGTLHILSLLI